jgi:hypothetical protein
VSEAIVIQFPNPAAVNATTSFDRQKFEQSVHLFAHN